jgi:branched-subunit amino acid ABC-type transport system permease component
MDTFVQQIINGLTIGSIYALIALGYTMVYGILRLINFAHGDIYMLGAYCGFFIARWLGLEPSVGGLAVTLLGCCWRTSASSSSAARRARSPSFCRTRRTTSSATRPSRSRSCSSSASRSR